jgi:hypothetical protein
MLKLYCDEGIIVSKYTYIESVLFENKFNVDLQDPNFDFKFGPAKIKVDFVGNFVGLSLETGQGITNSERKVVKGLVDVLKPIDLGTDFGESEAKQYQGAYSDLQDFQYHGDRE